MFTDGDFDSDGAVGLSDVAIFQRNIDPGVEAGRNAVPEPGTYLMAAMGMALIVVGSKWRALRSASRQNKFGDSRRCHFGRGARRRESQSVWENWARGLSVRS
jgi:hypothetical protein